MDKIGAQDEETRAPYKEEWGTNFQGVEPAPIAQRVEYLALECGWFQEIQARKPYVMIPTRGVEKTDNTN